MQFFYHHCIFSKNTQKHASCKNTMHKINYSFTGIHKILDLLRDMKVNSWKCIFSYDVMSFFKLISLENDERDKNILNKFKSRKSLPLCQHLIWIWREFGSDLKISNLNKNCIYELIWFEFGLHITHTKILTKFIDQPHSPKRFKMTLI